MNTSVGETKQFAAETMWMLAYFRQIYTHRIDLTAEGYRPTWLTDEQVQVERLHLAYSHDGLHWQPLNNNQPTWPEQFMRDPFIARGFDGAFHLLATGGGSARSCLYARSTDLIGWQHHALPLMEGVPGVANVWAPEFFCDQQRHEYVMFWSSSGGQHGWDDSRIWCARTPDFQTFSTPRVLFDPGYTVIDATIVQHDGMCYMIFKDERFGYVHGEHRYLQVATADQLDGPYTVVTEAITPSLTEGPAILQLPAAEQWLLLCDYCMSNRYGAFRSHDLRHWHEHSDTAFPANARHGSVFPITAHELETLQQHFGSERQK
jgi:hypothetical protein